MKNLLRISCVIILSLNGHTQGMHFGFGTLTSLMRFEVGGTLKNKIHFGGYFEPRFASLLPEMPISGGVYGRFSFRENELIKTETYLTTMRTYVGLNAGVSYRDGGIYEDWVTGYKYYVKEIFVPTISGLAGLEILTGSRGRISSYFELQVGKTPNIFRAALNADSDKISGNLGFLIGVRFYFRNKLIEPMN
jgi:hypothetical protein